jgi:hypothetical protein
MPEGRHNGSREVWRESVHGIFIRVLSVGVIEVIFKRLVKSKH